MSSAEPLPLQENTEYLRRGKEEWLRIAVWLRATHETRNNDLAEDIEQAVHRAYTLNGRHPTFLTSIFLGERGTTQALALERQHGKGDIS